MASTRKFLWEGRLAKVAILFSFVLPALGSLFGLVQALARTPGGWRRWALKTSLRLSCTTPA